MEEKLGAVFRRRIGGGVTAHFSSSDFYKKLLPPNDVVHFLTGRTEKILTDVFYILMVQ